jgi:hypothetical protein
MSERPSSRIPFELLKEAQEGLEKRGYYFIPVEKELTEAAITQPLVTRLRSQIKRRGFTKVAGHVIITFSGYDDDPREIHEIPEIRSYWRQLDAQVAELPALLAYLPELGFNGPGQYFMLLGEVDEMIHRPEMGGYDVHVKGAERILEQATHRIIQANAKYHVSPNQGQLLIARFVAGATHRFPPRKQ